MASVCRLCGSNQLTPKVSTIRGIWQRNYPVHYCNSCQAYFLESIPSDAEVEAYYQQTYYENVQSKAKDLFKRLFRDLRSTSQAIYVKKTLGSKKDLRVLEIGAGDGCLLDKFREIARDLQGLEFSSVYQQRAQKNYGIKLSSRNFQELHETFDLIILSHVYEHFTNLAEATRKLKSLLRPGGYLFVEVPHSPAPQELPALELQQYLNTTHIHNFTPQSLASYLQKTGFRVAAMDRFYYRLPVFLGRRRVAELGRLFVEGTGLSLSSGLIAMVYSAVHFVFRKKAFQPVDQNEPFLGFGDNIRIIVTPS